MPLFLLAALTGFLLSTTGCSSSSGGGTTEESVSNVQITALTLTNAVGGVLDEQSNATLASQENTQRATCTRPLSATCNAGVRSADYADCTTDSGTWEGSISLSYSDNACNMANSGTLTRELNLTLTRPLGAVITLSTDTSSDFEDNLIGGGSRLTQISNTQWDLTVLGVHYRYRRNSNTNNDLFNITIHSDVDLEIQGGLDRSSRIVDGGELVISHNRSRYRATIVPTNLRWDNECCHPVSGTLDITYSGTLTGSAEITYNGCGTIRHTRENITETLALTACY